MLIIDWNTGAVYQFQDYGEMLVVQNYIAGEGEAPPPPEVTDPEFRVPSPISWPFWG